MSEKFKALEQQGYSLRRNNGSVAPVVLLQRRLQEEWRAVEARCVSDAVTEYKDLAYGETFTMCFRDARK